MLDPEKDNNYWDYLNKLHKNYWDYLNNMLDPEKDKNYWDFYIFP
jgi:hypothetical protein